MLLVTGGCGFIGSSLIKSLLGRDEFAKIRVLDDLSVGSRHDLKEVCDFKEYEIGQGLSPKADKGHPQVELAVGNIRSLETCIGACEGVSAIVHLAANTGVGPSIEDPMQDMQTNVIGTFNILEAARRKNIKKVIFASSGAPLGDVTPPINEEKAPKPLSPYGASKLAGEGYCSAYAGSFGLQTIALRFGNVYGPRSKHKGSVVAKFIKGVLNGEPLEIYGDGNQTRDFIFIDDLIDAIALSLKAKGLGGEVFQIATHKETTVNEIAIFLKQIFETNGLQNIEILYRDSRVGDAKRNYSDISKAKKLLGYSPKVPLEKGLRLTFDYFFLNRGG